MFEPMNEFGVDTLKAARALEAAGFEAAQAETLVAVFHGFAAGHGATREQVRDLESTLKTEIAKLHLSVEGLKTRMYQLMLGQVVIIVGLIVSLDRLL